MHSIGEYIGCQYDTSGDLFIMCAIPDDPAEKEKLLKLQGEKVIIDIVKYSEKRSLNANAYFWKVCDMIAKKLGSDKDTIYLLMLRDAGVFDMIDVIAEAVDRIKGFFRYVEEEYRYPSLIVKDGEEREVEMCCLKCYKGSHEYNKKEMADLINHTVNEAHDLGIDTWTAEEINNLVERWEGK